MLKLKEKRELEIINEGLSRKTTFCVSLVKRKKLKLERKP